MDEEWVRSHVRLDAVSAGRARPFTITNRHKASLLMVPRQTLAVDTREGLARGLTAL